MNTIILSVALILLQSCAAWSSSNEVLKLAGNKRIEASICADSMNRIAVANDRISQIFGDEGAFESQHDEATGQVFLKPTADNGAKNLSLTLMTEQGITQDLTLKPTAKSAKTLILGRGPGHQNGETQSFSGNTPQYLNQDLFSLDTPVFRDDSRLGQLLSFLKQAMTGQLPPNEDGKALRKQYPEGCSLTPSQSWQGGPYDVHALKVENLTETPLELEEKDFYEPGDVALSFDAIKGAHAQQHVLAPKETTTLYVVCHRKADFP